jgi:hypothetical protein
LSAAATATALVSEPPRPSVVMRPGRHALEAGDHRDLALGHAGQDRFAVDALDSRLGMGIVGVDRQLPAQPRTAFRAHRLKRQRQEAAGHLLTAGHHHVILGGSYSALASRQKLTSRSVSRHGRHHNRHLMSRFLLALDDTRHAPDALGAGHRGAAEFHHDPGHLLRLLQV